MKRRSMIKAAAVLPLLAGCSSEQLGLIGSPACDGDDGGGGFDSGVGDDAGTSDASMVLSSILRLGIGQSNPLGFNNNTFPSALLHPNRPDIPTSRIVYIGGVEYTSVWQPLQDIGHAEPAAAPVHWHNPELACVTRLRDLYGYDVASCLVARGGTGFNFWRGIEVGVAGNLYQKTRDFVYGLYAAYPTEMANRTIVLNVNLGEQSAQFDVESQMYGQYMIELINALRGHFPAIQHVMVTRLHEQAKLHPSFTYAQRIIDHQIAICASEGYILQDPNPLGVLRGDNAHYTSALNYEIGLNEADLWHAALTT